MLNSIHLMGTCVETPELKMTKQTGIFVTCFQLAVDREKTKPGEPVQTDYFDIVAFRDVAERAGKYLSAGTLIVVEGKLRTRSYKDSDGKERKAIEVFADGIYFKDTAKDSPFNMNPNKADK